MLAPLAVWRSIAEPSSGWRATAPITPRLSSLANSRVGRADHDFLDADGRRAVRDAVGLRRLPLRVAPGADHLPRLLTANGVQVPPEIGGDRVVGDVGHHARDPAVLDLPEAIAAELAVVALLIDRVAAAAVDEHAVFRVLDDLIAVRRPFRPRLEPHVRHAQERVVAPRGCRRAAFA